MKKDLIVKLVKETPRAKARKIKVGEIGGTTEDLDGSSKVVFLCDLLKGQYNPLEVEDSALEVVEGRAFDKNGRELFEYDEVVLDSDDYEFRRGARGIIIHHEFLGGVAIVDFVSEFDEKENQDTILNVKTKDLLKS